MAGDANGAAGRCRGGCGSAPPGRLCGSLARQDLELTAVAQDGTTAALKLGIRYVSRLGWLGHVSLR